MKRIILFRIRKEEIVPALIGILLFLFLNTLMVMSHFDLFTRCGRMGFYSLFTTYFHLSGFDPFTYIILSQWRLLYSLVRHPLLGGMMYPFSELNSWLMDEFGMNFAIIIMAVLLVVMDVYSFLFVRRILRWGIGLRKWDSTLLTMLLFSFGYMMVTAFAPDHFAISLFLLTMTLYIATMKLRGGQMMSGWQTAVLYFLTAGVTLSNGAKVFLAALFTNGKKVFRWKWLLIAFLLPTLLMGGLYYWQRQTILKPQLEQAERIAQQRLAKDTAYVKKMERLKKVIDRNKQGKLSDNAFFEWTDLGAPRGRTFVENLFGEGIQLHEDYLLEDVNGKRPIFVEYRHWYNYAVEALIVILFLGGILVGRHDKLMWMFLSWLAFDTVLHMLFGFGIIEVYIMSAHWMFLIPLCMGYLFLKAQGRWLWLLRCVILLLCLYLYVYNGMLVYQFLYS